MGEWRVELEDEVPQEEEDEEGEGHAGEDEEAVGGVPALDAADQGLRQPQRVRQVPQLPLCILQI